MHTEDSLAKPKPRRLAADSLSPSKLAYTVEEFGDLTSVGRTRLYAEIKIGRLIARKLGRRTLITRDDGAAWLSSLHQIASPRSVS